MHYINSSRLHRMCVKVLQQQIQLLCVRITRTKCYHHIKNAGQARYIPYNRKIIYFLRFHVESLCGSGQVPSV